MSSGAIDGAGHPGHIACDGGPEHGQWFTEEEWGRRVRSHQRMRELGQTRSSGALDYIVTSRIVGNPDRPGLTARRAVHHIFTL